MKDAEFIYSLYVQANPVPDPDLLPLTRDEAALVSFERSPDMIDQEQTSRDLSRPPKRSRIGLALGAAAVLIILSPGEPYVPDWLLEPGTYLFECTTGEQAGGIPEHLWRVAQVEVVAAP